jgi:hypothetical protein
MLAARKCADELAWPDVRAKRALILVHHDGQPGRLAPRDREAVTEICCLKN